MGSKPTDQIQPLTILQHTLSTHNMQIQLSSAPYNLVKSWPFISFEKTEVCNNFFTCLFNFYGPILMKHKHEYNCGRLIFLSGSFCQCPQFVLFDAVGQNKPRKVCDSLWSTTLHQRRLRLGQYAPWEDTILPPKSAHQIAVCWMKTVTVYWCYQQSVRFYC